MQIFPFKPTHQKFLGACLSIVVLVASLGCSEQAPLDLNGNPFTADSIHALIDDLGKHDVNISPRTPLLPATTVLMDKRRAAVQTLSELGDNAMPMIIERLSKIPELEQTLMNQSTSDDYKLKLSWLIRRKADLITLVAGSRNKEHGKLLLSLVDTQVGTGKVQVVGLVLALRGLGAKEEERVMLDRLFKEPHDRMAGGGALLERLLTMRNATDKALAVRVAAWPLESRIKGRAVLLATRLEVKEPIVAEIKAVLARADLPPEIRYPPYELGLHLSALAELLPPDEYMAFTEGAELLKNNHFRSVVQAAQARNQFWWAAPAEKDALALKLFVTDKCDNDILALHYMLKNKRIDLLNNAGLVFDSNALKRQTQPEIKPYYEVQPGPHNRIQATGYKLSAVDGKVIIDDVPGFGMFD